MSETTRLRRLECSQACGYPPLRVTRKAIRAGLPVCPCGAVLWPSALEDAVLAADAGSLSRDMLGQHPEMIEFRRECSSVLHGQASHVQRGRNVRGVEDLAMRRVLSRRAAAARANRARSMARDPDPIPF